ncbi:ScbR family autoregulator-binding transcription factor [Streptomyces sp. Tu 3180]|uniref:ScbR family autoregulator-binding transcription factor n=1 Tax=Streptomyces sp. Tu 3180 TaxID=2682611 RepID=UPI00135B58D4|nr:ScbR family autoregulator-binding transcription factor [Streptomyces sp. Tu 3180]KAF3463164.1 TetR/AcrR family transcriptional regulator [Streptomyces sp. Tu 3180]KAF3469352.1 TetR/AcrR family transcriptional regulator [Streptomyces sp. Tu 3180]
MALQERAVRTRHSILVAAAAVFAEVGYEAATISEILQRASVTKGALYFHFSSKEELAQEVLAHQLASAPPLPARRLALQEGLDATFLLAHLLSTGDPLVRGSIRLTVDQGSPQDGLDRQVPMAAWLQHNVALLTRARDNGELLPHVDIEDAARVFVAAFTGCQILSKIMTGHADLAERVSSIERHLMSSIAVPAVLIRLDMAPDRGARVYEQALQLRREAGAVAVD